jgi:hypothetical protein
LATAASPSDRLFTRFQAPFLSASAALEISHRPDMDQQWIQEIVGLTSAGAGEPDVPDKKTQFSIRIRASRTDDASFLKTIAGVRR